MHELTGQLNVKLINCHLDELLACILCSIEVESLSHCLTMACYGQDTLEDKRVLTTPPFILLLQV